MAEDNDEGRWRPLSVRRAGGDAAVEYEALHEGVPPWLKQSLRAWVTSRLQPKGYWSTDRLQRLERVLRRPLAWDRDPGDALLVDLEEDDDLFLEVVDYLLRDLRWSADKSNYELVSILMMLQEAGSAWEVASRGHGYALERRVLEGVAASARKAFEAKGPGDHLRRAWAAAYGRDPDPSMAYSQAVKAVEAAAQPIVSPDDAKATLGKMVVALRDKPEKWDVVLAARPDFDRVTVVRLMAELLWQGQTDRHGMANPRPVTQDQAEAAVHLAVVMVQWFTAGSIRRRS